jgi:hypothetical protein
MKLILPLLLILAACSETPVKTEPQPDVEMEEPAPIKQEQETDRVVLGDLNFDKRPDTAIVYEPLYAEDNLLEGEYGECADDSCVTRVIFSFTDVQLNHTMALGFYSFFATHDLNDDGVREIAFIPDWFQSCWSALFVYSLQNDEWIKLGGANVYACEEENFEDRIRKINSRKFEITGQEWNDDFTEIMNVSKEIKME